MKYLLLIIVFTLVNVNTVFSTNDTTQCYNHLGKAWELKYSNPENSFKHIDSALLIAEAIKSDDLIAKSLYYKAMINYLQGNYGETFKFVEESKKHYLKQNDSYGMASLHNLMGLAYQNIGAYEDAILSYEESLVAAKKTENLYATSNPIHNIGLLYALMGKPLKSIENYQQALIIRFEINDTILIAQSYQAIGAAYSYLEQWDSALVYSNQSIEWLNYLESTSLADLALTQSNLALIYTKTGNYIAADTLLNKSIKTAKRIEAYNILVKALVNKADKHYYKKELDKANAWSDSAYFYSKKYGYISELQESLEIKKKIFEIQKDYKNALTIQDRLNFIKDSLNTSNYINQLSILNVKNRVNEYNEKISNQKLTLAEQEKNIAEQQLKVKQRNYTLLGLGLIIIFVLTLGFFIYKQQKLKQQQLIEENRLKDQLAQAELQNKLHNERLRISGDLHDNIGSQLTFIISSVDNMKYLFKTADEKLTEKLNNVSEFTRTTITQLRDTIWALNKDEITFSDLKARLYNYLKNAELAQEQTKFIFSENLESAFHLNSIEGVCIYRIIQEALNNSMKYAAATQVELTITETPTQIVLQLVDDGIGFNIADVVLGNGLENMKNRAQSINAAFKIDSHPAKGTMIILSLNKNTLNAV